MVLSLALSINFSTLLSFSNPVSGKRKRALEKTRENAEWKQWKKIRCQDLAAIIMNGINLILSAKFFIYGQIGKMISHLINK